MNPAAGCLKQFHEPLFARAVHWYHDPCFGELKPMVRDMQHGIDCSASRIDLYRLAGTIYNAASPVPLRHLTRALLYGVMD